jgi:hypothetical protein
VDKMLARLSSLLALLFALNPAERVPSGCNVLLCMQCPPVFGPMRFLALAREAGNFLERSECRTA